MLRRILLSRSGQSLRPVEAGHKFHGWHGLLLQAESRCYCYRKSKEAFRLRRQGQPLSLLNRHLYPDNSFRGIRLKSVFQPCERHDDSGTCHILPDS